MKSSSSAGAGAVSGCIVWVLVFAALSSCLLPAAMMIGGFTSVTKPVIQFTGSIICPEDTTPDVYTYATTTTNENGFTQPSTAYVLECLDSSGERVMENHVGYAFLWIGILAGVALILAVILAFALAAPAGVLVARMLKRNRKPGNIEPA
jgi:hypothetical protein